MGLTASIEIKGRFLKNKNIFDLLNNLPLEIKLIHDGEIIVGIEDADDDKGVDSKCITYPNFSIENILSFIQSQENLRSIYIGIEIESAWHYFDFFLFDISTIDISIVGNRKKIDNRYTDFSFYYQNLIKVLVREDFQIGSIIYSDIDLGHAPYKSFFLCESCSI